MSAHPTWRDVLTDGILAERHGADLLFGSAAVRALETAAYRALAPNAPIPDDARTALVMPICNEDVQR
ncbi:hypothetical protein ACQCRI_23755, partial [Ralstonia pseudosolanacearum]|uniref:hypothetical protein n=1 Tax=Ralstonia pseudosolanacearum TaxID=1310165 RepID=UPI003CEB0DDA